MNNIIINKILLYIVLSIHGKLFHIGFECYNRRQVYTLNCPSGVQRQRQCLVMYRVFVRGRNYSDRLCVNCEAR